MIKSLLKDNSEIKSAMETLRSTIGASNLTNANGTVTVN